MTTTDQIAMCRRMSLTDPTWTWGKAMLDLAEECERQADEIKTAVARLADLEEQLDSVCFHQNCEMVSGRKRDYLYCNDCKTNLESDGT